MSRVIIFDLDGTLVDSCLICVNILSDMLFERGSDHVIDVIGARKYMSRGGVDMVSALLGSECRDANAELADFRARYQTTFTPRESLFPGVSEGLEALRAAGFTLAICSNKPQNLCDKVLKDTGLDRHFALVVGGRAGLRPKPHLDLLDVVLDDLRCAPADCVFIGDSELDHAVASASGMAFKFVTYGYAEDGWMPDRGDIYDCFPTMSASILTGVVTTNA
ncbi:MAG: HAD family hydrolase [Sphingopyxis macrogoltabida]|uniref:phosphoglycolate phosphatase n=1 Tax=Sphingopyxis macrogoltabida TaxID=33050 RepID=A0A2W5KYT6_SPHMC|nr:MAG: HAD family hydrolase [Sphingopyxis macrogoltabida]